MKLCGLFSLFTVLIFGIYSAEAITKAQHNKVVTCYIASWAYYRIGIAKFGPNDLPPQYCTHVIYAFAGLNPNSSTIRSLDTWGDIEEGGVGNYKRLTKLREKDPDLKISLAIGGWDEGSENYSKLASSPDRRKVFIKSIVDFLGKYGFDGFDLDWEFPAARGGTADDKQNFVSLVKELKEAFIPKRYLLTAAISSNIPIIDKGYDIVTLSKYLDYIYLMAYDYYGTWDLKVLPNSPLRNGNEPSVENSIKHLLQIGTPQNKLVLGVPMYGRTFILQDALPDSKQSPIGQPCLNTGFEGPYTKQKGFMGYNEICQETTNQQADWHIGWHEESSTPYAVKGTHVVVYDDPRSMNEKVKLAMEFDLAGIMVWSIDTDHIRGNCSISNADGLYPLVGNSFSLMRSINLALATYGEDNNVETTTPKPGSTNQTSYSSLLILFALFVSYF